MNDGAAADTRTLRFAEAVRNFAEVPPKRFAALLPHRDGIAELRLKGASFGMIRELLAMAGIEVAADTVRRFYREVIEEPRTGGKRPSKREQSAAPAPRNLPAPTPATAPIAAAVVPTTATEQSRSRGPRVADRGCKSLSVNCSAIDAVQLPCGSGAAMASVASRAQPLPQGS